MTSIQPKEVSGIIQSGGGQWMTRGYIARTILTGFRRPGDWDLWKEWMHDPKLLAIGNPALQYRKQAVLWIARIPKVVLALAIGFGAGVLLMFLLR